MYMHYFNVFLYVTVIILYVVFIVDLADMTFSHDLAGVPTLVVAQLQITANSGNVYYTNAFGMFTW